MSTMFWNALKVSPAILGASLLVASSTYAAQRVPNPTAAAPAESAVESASQLSETSVEGTSVAAIAQPTVESNTQASQTPIESISLRQQTPLETRSKLNLADGTPVAQMPAEGGTSPDATNVLQEIDNYNNNSLNDTTGDSLDQLTNVSQLRDVSPGDWAYEALRNLVERYGCIAGYPDGTYRGNRATTRYEFAAGLNACLQQIERLIQGQGDVVTREDFETLQRLVQEFEAELATLGTRVDNLEGRVAFLEDHQFSTTTKLNGEVIFALADIFGDDDDLVDPDGNDVGNQEAETVFFDRVRLNFDTSFTGRDRLRTRLQAGNYRNFDFHNSVTQEGRLGFTATGENDVTLEKLWYRFPFGDAATVHLFANAGNYDDFVPVLNPALESSGTGSISRFGRYSPIYRMGDQGTGIGVSIAPKSPIRFDFGYLTDEGNNPDQGAGLFDGDYSALAQVTFQPSSALGIAATYVHSYNSSDLRHGTGSIPSQVNAGRPVVGNSYGVEASFAFSPSIILSGWAAFTDAIVIGRGGANVWTYGATLALRDLGSEGSVLGFVVGMEPKLTDVDGVVDLEEDDDTGLHVEGFYKLQVSDNISITPGVIWLTSPGHNDENDSVFVGTVRTTFTF